MDEMKQNEHLSTEELIFKIIRLFGGLNINVPSYNELLLFQYLLNNSDRYMKKLAKAESLYNPWEDFVRMIKVDYQGPIQDVNLQQVVIGFIDAVTGKDYEAFIKEKEAKVIIKRKKYRQCASEFFKDVKEGLKDECNSDDCPSEEIEEENDEQ